MAPNPMTGFPTRERRETWTQGHRGNTQREEGQAKSEAGISVRPPQAKGCQEPLEAARNKEGLSPRAFRGTQPWPTPLFRLLGPELCDNAFLPC